MLLADRIRVLGYTHATKAGISIALKDMIIPAEEAGVPGLARKEVAEIENQYLEGLITDGERYNKVIDIWARDHREGRQRDDAADLAGGGRRATSKDGKRETRKQPSFNPIYIMADSGARGSAQQIRQLAGMRGLMAKPSGEIIETPITANFREGLSVLQYFISTHGARKGLADTALKTANSGYLTRRLVDVAQDAIITEYDCGTMDGLVHRRPGRRRRDHRAAGRAHPGPRGPGRHPRPGHAAKCWCAPTRRSTRTRVRKIENAGLDKVKIRSVLTCQATRGICVECYGRDLARGRKVVHR